jgi:tripeptidyl-peptidase-2
MPARSRAAFAAFAVPSLVAACASAVGAPEAAVPPAVAAATAAPAPQAPPGPRAIPKPRDPVAPPDVAYRLGLMPTMATGVAAWRLAHPAYDGRGALIAILDSGVDPSVPGLQTTTTGQPKILDLRNFSGEGDIPLVRVHPDGEGRIALPGGPMLLGAATVRAVAADSAWYGGVIRELPFGDAPAADFNGNGSNRDSYGVVVVRSGSGWVAFIDTNGDGSLADERPIADYLVGAQTFTFRADTGAPGSGPIAGAVNLSEDAGGRPRLSLVLDTAGHGTHVAGIAAGRDLYGVQGFDGVAPGAQIIGLKIADDARGGLSTTGSMITAMDYAVRFAAERRLPLVLNMSFGVGNMEPGAAAMDSLVDAFLLAHPDVVFAISAGNDGPGTSTMGFPASAQFALAVGALYPSPFGPLQFGAESPDVLGWWSSRGGELDKPDVVTPGMAYSTVPRWNTGEEVKLGTSMSSPHAAGVVALLLSAMRAESRRATGAEVTQALRATARPLAEETAIDQGYGVPQVEAAYAWLESGRTAARFRVRALPPARPATDVVRPYQAGPRVGVARSDASPAAAYRRMGLLAPDDTIQRFLVSRHADGGRPGQAAPRSFRFTADAPWLRAARDTVTLGSGGTAEIEVRYDPARLARPGRYVGALSAWPVPDSSSGPAFRLLNVVVVPDSGQWRTVTESSRKLKPSGTRRFYLNIPVGAADLSLRLAVPDTTERGYLYLFEPNGRPSRTTDRVNVGGSGGAQALLSVTANDIRPGVWEAVVQAVPGRELRYDFAASVPAVSVARVDSVGAAPSVTLRSQTARDTTLVVTADQVGVVQEWEASVERGVPYRRSFAAPEWATGIVVEVRLTPEFWNSVTDFGIVLYDRDGAQLGQGAMNYDFHRVTAELPAKRAADFPVTVELFPAFARPEPPASFGARVRLAFTGPARPLAPSPLALAIPAHGTAEVAIPRFTSLAPSPDWWDLLRVRVTGSPSDWIAIERQMAVRRQ